MVRHPQQPKCGEHGPKRGRYGFLCSLIKGHFCDHEARNEKGETLDKWPRFPKRTREALQ